MLQRWMRIEMASVTNALVTATRVIGDLAADVAAGDVPQTRTRGGEPFVYDADAVLRLNAVLSPLQRRRLRVPVTVWAGQDVPDAASIADAVAVDALKAVGRVRPDQEMTGGRLWLSLSLAHDVAREFPTLFQFVYH